MPQKRKHTESARKRYKRLSELGAKARTKPTTTITLLNPQETDLSVPEPETTYLRENLTVENAQTVLESIPGEQSNMARPSTSAEIDSVIYETVPPKTENVESVLEGRRLVDIQHFFNSIKNLNDHKPFDCHFSHMYFMREIKKGLCSVFVFKCSMCNIEKRVSTERVLEKNETAMDANAAAVFAAISTGCGYAQLNQQHALCNIPSLTTRQYSKYNELVSQSILDSSWVAMEEAGKEELGLAREIGDVDADNNGLITVIADGAWSKRSYKVNYDAPSGTACIVGAKTGKLLFVASRNKYCAICARATSKNVNAQDHVCYKNWNGSSTGMESDIILEGFKASVGMHKLKYVKLVGDGDSSVYKKLCTERPYGGNCNIQKVECTNHLLRNYCTRLREICTRRKSSSNQVIPLKLRAVVKANIHRLRIGIKKALLHRRKEAVSIESQLIHLKSDISNCPHHVFGNHENCGTYFCKGSKEAEVNYVPDFQNCGLMNDLLACGNRLQQTAPSLLLNMNNNAAECYNSVVAKVVGGKRINFSLKNSYEVRCRIAALQFNEHENYISKIYKTMTTTSPGKYTKLYIDKTRRKRLYNLKRKQLFSTKIKPRNTFSSADADYGAVGELSPTTLESRKEELLSLIATSNIRELEIKTRGQSSNPLWKMERMYRLTASNFGAVCKLRKSTDPKKLAKRIVNSNFTGSAATRWGIDHEPIAKAKFIEYYKIEEAITESGLFVDADFPHLGASPDGLLSGGDIIEIKCPYSSRQLTPEEGVFQKKIKCLEACADGIYRLKKTDNYYNQVQGQLALSGAKFCYFVVWTPLGIIVDKIAYDKDFWNAMLPKLNEFYYNVMIPEILKHN